MVDPLRIRDLQHRHRDGEQEHRVLAGIDLRVAPGEVVAILGPSGSGKTTLLQLVAGLTPLQSGDIHLAGHSLRDTGESHRAVLRRRTIGFVFQFFNLIPTLTALENCALPLQLNGRPAPRELLLDWLRSVGLEQRADTLPARLSGGEQQRLALVRALIHEPALVLADEPTGNLDDTTAASAAELLFGQLERCGSAALLATHSEALARRAHRRLWLRGGRLHPQPG